MAVQGQEPFFQLTDVHFAYNPGSEQEIRALRGVNLDVWAGEYVAILGHNGSGKSTLARHLNALLLPTRGRVRVAGLDTCDPKSTIEIRRRVGMVFQEPDNQIVGTIVEEDVAFGPENLGVPPLELERRVESALAQVGLRSYRYRAPHHLSGGQKQLLAIAGALAMESKCLILDEATSMLGPPDRREVLGIIRRLNDAGVTIIAVTHSMEEAIEADKVIIMNAGIIALWGRPDEVFSDESVLRGLRMKLPTAARVAKGLRERGYPLPEGILTTGRVVQEVDELARSRRGSVQR